MICVGNLRSFLDCGRIQLTPRLLFVPEVESCCRGGSDELISCELLKNVDTISPNEHELQTLLKSIEEGASSPEMKNANQQL